MTLPCFDVRRIRLDQQISSMHQFLQTPMFGPSPTMTNLPRSHLGDSLMI